MQVSTRLLFLVLITFCLFIKKMCKFQDLFHQSQLCSHCIILTNSVILPVKSPCMFVMLIFNSHFDNYLPLECFLLPFSFPFFLIFVSFFSDELEEHEKYFVNVVIGLLSSYKVSNYQSHSFFSFFNEIISNA